MSQDNMLDRIWNWHKKQMDGLGYHLTERGRGLWIGHQECLVVLEAINPNENPLDLLHILQKWHNNQLLALDLSDEGTDEEAGRRFVHESSLALLALEEGLWKKREDLQPVA